MDWLAYERVEIINQPGPSHDRPAHGDSTVQASCSGHDIGTLLPPGLITHSTSLHLDPRIDFELPFPPLAALCR
jgi:hypothetical protein